MGWTIQNTREGRRHDIPSQAHRGPPYPFGSCWSSKTLSDLQTKTLATSWEDPSPFIASKEKSQECPPARMGINQNLVFENNCKGHLRHSLPINDFRIIITISSFSPPTPLSSIVSVLSPIQMTNQKKVLKKNWIKWICSHACINNGFK